MTGQKGYVELLQGLLELTERLKETVAEGDWEQVAACLDARQAVMDAIDALPAARLAESDRALAGRLLQQTTELDRELAPRLQVALEAIRVTIAENTFTRETISAYRRTSHGNKQVPASRFVDTQR